MSLHLPLKLRRTAPALSELSEISELSETSETSDMSETSNSSLSDSGSLSDREYDRLTAAVLASVEADADRWLQEDLIDIDTLRTGGLLELSFPNRSKIIINTQPPLHELWLATKAGGFHFRHASDGRWVDTRDGTAFGEALSREASAQGGRELRFAVAGG